MKTCKICRLLKENSEFHKKSDNKDGLFTFCKECFRSKQKTYYMLNKKKILERTAKYEKENAVSRKAYRDAHKDARREYAKKYYWEDDDRRKKINARRQNAKALTKYPQCTCCTKESLIEFYINKPDAWQVDHIICSKLGGIHCLKNLQYLSETDHIAKGYEERKMLQNCKENY